MLIHLARNADGLGGSVLRADVDGQIMMRAYLSGTPECKFGLNDKLVLQKRYGAVRSRGRCGAGLAALPAV